jgi:acetyl esterase/lipase
MAAPVAAAFVLGFRPLSESRAANVTDRLAGMAELPGHLRPFVLQTDACPRERLGTIDLYLPAASVPRPAVLFVHGGPIPADLRPTPRDWPAYVGYGQAAAARGVVGVTLDHRLHGAGDFETAAADLAAAAWQARADPRVDPGRLALWFFSGGCCWPTGCAIRPAGCAAWWRPTRCWPPRPTSASIRGSGQRRRWPAVGHCRSC